MNSPESKFILRAWRADGRYSEGDPLFAEALAETRRDTALLEWFEREQALDAVIANKVDGIPPPAGLRESILVGARASRPRRRWWQSSVWLAAAAVVVAALVLPPLLRSPRAPAFGAAAIAQFGLGDLATTHGEHQGHAALLAGVQAKLASVVAPFSANLSIDTRELSAVHCRSVTFAGHEVFEVCFEREGTWYHLYVTRRESSVAVAARALPVFAVKDGFNAAAWADAHNLYALVTHASTDAIKRVL